MSSYSGKVLICDDDRSAGMQHAGGHRRRLSARRIVLDLPQPRAARHQQRQFGFGFIGRAVVDIDDLEAEAQVGSARAALAEAKSQLSVTDADQQRYAALEAYSHITAPFAGVVTKRYADTGALIQAGTTSETQSMPVVKLAQWSRLRLVVPVPESAVPELRLGQTIDVVVPSLGRPFKGKVARFADALNIEQCLLV